jgi:TolA-binding protein
MSGEGPVGLDRTRSFFSWCAGLALVMAIAGRLPAQNVPEQGDVGDLKLANRLLADRLYGPAADEYERVLTRPNLPNSERIEATYGLGTARLFLNRLPEARKQFEDFLALAPQHPAAGNALFRVGETAYLLGDLDAARAALERFTSQYPDHKQNETAWPYLGDVALRQGDLERARRAYEKSLGLHPNGRLADRARCGLARALATLGKPDQALALLTSIADAPGRELADQARFQIGQVHAAADRPEQALAAFERLERDTPRSALVPEARLGRAAALIKLKRRDQAEALLRALIAESPRNQAAQAAYELGLSQLERNRPAEARATFQDALTRFGGAPAVPALLYRAAEAEAQLGLLDEARTRFVKMAALFPRDPWADDALVQAANLALKAKDLGAAEETAARLVDAYPESTLIPAALLVRARVAEEGDKPAEAVRLFESLLGREGLTPDLIAEARYHLGLAYRKAGQKDKSNDVLGQLARTPGDAGNSRNARFLVGQAFIEEGKYAEAIEPLEDYLKALPDGEVADVALAHLVHARVELDQAGEATKALKRLESLFPKSPELSRAKLRLGEHALKANDNATAARLLQQVADSDEATWKSRALFGLGWALLKDKKPAEAIEVFDGLLARYPEDTRAAETAYLRGKALEASGKDDDALDAFSRTEHIYPRTKAAGSAALARARLLAELKRPDSADAFASYVKTYTQQGDGGTDAVLAEWGAALNQAGRIDEADKVFGRLLEQFPSSPQAAEARLNLAVSSFDARKFDEADERLAPVLADESGIEAGLLGRALFLKGRLLLERKQWDEARRTFDRVVSLSPDGPDAAQARSWKAEVAFRSGDPKTAEAEFAALSEGSDPNKTVALRRVQCLVQLQQWDEALRRAEALRAGLAPDDRLRPELEYQRGRALQSVAPPRFDEARTAYDAVLAAKPPDELAARAQFMKGETYFFAQDFANARREFLKAYAQYDAPRWQAAGLLEAGKVYERLDQWPEAVEIYERLRSRFQDVPEAADSLTEGARRLEGARRKAAEAGRQPEGPGTDR